MSTPYFQIGTPSVQSDNSRHTGPTLQGSIRSDDGSLGNSNITNLGATHWEVYLLLRSTDGISILFFAVKF